MAAGYGTVSSNEFSVPFLASAEWLLLWGGDSSRAVMEEDTICYWPVQPMLPHPSYEKNDYEVLH